MTADSTCRAEFVNNVKALLSSNKNIRGIDIDWEYPGKKLKGSEWETEFGNYISLLSELKVMMTALGKTNGNNYRLTKVHGAKKLDTTRLLKPFHQIWISSFKTQM